MGFSILVTSPPVMPQARCDRAITIVGGLVGYNYGGSITSSYATGTVTSSGNNAGGLAGGSSGGSITSSYATGTVMGAGHGIGGLAGASSGMASPPVMPQAR